MLRQAFIDDGDDTPLRSSETGCTVDDARTSLPSACQRLTSLCPLSTIPRRGSAG